MNGEMRKIKVLPNNIEKALGELCNTLQFRNKVNDEIKYFQLYLNFAVVNIQNIADVNVTDEKKIASAIEAKGDGVIQKLANFLWLFNVDDPARDFKDYKKITLKLITKIFALRNLFAHPQGTDISALLSDREFYVLLEGILLSYARDNALAEGLKTDKLFKLKLMNQHSLLKQTDILFDPNKQYVLKLQTRKNVKIPKRRSLSCFTAWNSMDIFPLQWTRSKALLIPWAVFPFWSRKI